MGQIRECCKSSTWGHLKEEDLTFLEPPKKQKHQSFFMGFISHPPCECRFYSIFI